MIDIHTHLLPCVDDGSQSLEESRNLLQQAIEDGITDICLTPHFCRIDEFIYKKEYISNKFNEFKESCSDLKINLYLGNEIMIERNIDTLIENNELCTINDSKYVLIEFPFNEYKDEYDEYLYDISSLGLKVIIAHPERYRFINEELIDKWLSNGYILQANASSFEIKDRKKLLFKLIEEGKLSLVSSDAHSEHRPALLKDAYELIKHKFNQEVADTLFNVNPYNILNNETIIKLNKTKKKLF